MEAATEPQPIEPRGPVYLELQFSPSIELISNVRRFVSTFYTQVIDDAGCVAGVALAAHELLENAVKYSVDGETKIRLQVSYAPEGMQVLIRTWNRGDKAHVEVLQGRLSAMARAASPDAYYLECMRESARRKTGSGLGLARIRAETDMGIEMKLEDGWVVVEAKINLERAPGR